MVGDMRRILKEMSFSDEDQIDTAVEKAQAAWDTGLLSFIFKPMALAILDSESLNRAVDRILRIGWRLHGTALVYNQTCLNSEQAMFTFLRPM